MMRTFIFVLSACAVVPTACVRYHPQSLSPAVTGAALESRTLTDPGLREFLVRNGATPTEPWDLERLTLAAFYYHPDLDLARARWGTARAGLVTAGERPNPVLGFTPTYNAPAAEGAGLWTLGFSLDLPIETFHKRGYRQQQARSLAESARLAIGAAAWQVRGRVRAALTELWWGGSRVSLTTDQLGLRQKLVALLERRLAAGEASQLDVTRERIARDQVRLSLRDAERQAAEARSGLATSVGIPARALEGVDISMGAIERTGSVPVPLSTDTVRRAALLGRADVLALLSQYEAAEAAVRLEVARQYPDLHLGPGFAWDQGQNKYTFGASFALPLLNRNRGPIREAEGRRTELAARFTQLQAQVIGQVDSALAGYRAAARMVATADSLLEVQRRNAHEIEVQFRAGETDRVALVSAQIEVATTALTRLDAQVRERHSLGQLEDAIQRPLFGAVAPVPETQPGRDAEVKR